MRERSCEVLIFGGGFAGLWILDSLVREGYDALLLESRALGAGQSIQAQGIIHGGGKYALRGVSDFAAVKAIREMPERWRRSLSGQQQPDLSPALLLSDVCHLFVPRAGMLSRLSAHALLPVVRKAGLLHAGPVKLSVEQWPRALQGSARAVYSMTEPVIATGSALAVLAARHPRRLLRYAPGESLENLKLDLKQVGEYTVEIEDPEVEGKLRLRPKAVVFAAGAGNEGLVRRSECGAAPMQRRPLRMSMLRGSLPPLYAHMVRGGKTAMTVTTHPLQADSMADNAGQCIWQLGGELAERSAGEAGAGILERELPRQLRRFFPGVDFSRVLMASYSAVRAEARSRDQRRPSGVQVKELCPGVLVAWPTKMALSPILAREVYAELNRVLSPSERR
ncbi:MAG TPA: FAD-dependent oxidoreductase, partial [Candidatus Krumholzibacteria bacterium]|nr:FAD-dependent oxidoreductase [Candidatus Krumholzibacteria bacterium]